MVIVGEIVIVDVVAPVDQLYVPPVWSTTAVKVLFWPEQIVKDWTETVGAGFTVIVVVAIVGLQPVKE